MNRSKTIALILGPCLVVIALLAGYWVKTQQMESGAPLQLHAGLASQPLAAVAPPGAHPSETEAPADKAAVATPAPDPSSPALSTAPVPTPAAPNPAVISPPKFDVVRVEPSGEAVIAGHTEPNAQVAVISNGKVIAEGKADASGQFVLLPAPLPPGEHELALRMTPLSGAAVVSDQNVAVSVPVKGKGEVMVALAEPGKATVLLTDPTAKEPAKAETSAKSLSEAKPASASGKPEVSIKTAEIVEPGGFFATGTAAPGAHLRLYLNGSVLAEVIAGTDGRWSVKVGKGLVPGHYAVRADQIAESNGGVIACAEVPFDYMPAPAPKEAVAAAEPPGEVSASDHTSQTETAGRAKLGRSEGFIVSAMDSASPADKSAAVVAEIQTATVDKGNSLWRISRRTLGVGTRYTEIYAANSEQIRDPKLIYPGQVFVIPGQTN